MAVYADDFASPSPRRARLSVVAPARPPPAPDAEPSSPVYRLLRTGIRGRLSEFSRCRLLAGFVTWIQTADTLAQTARTGAEIYGVGQPIRVPADSSLHAPPVDR
jgi:hypothetical protein